MTLELILRSLNFRQVLLKQFSSILLRNNLPRSGYFDCRYGAWGLRQRTSWTKAVGKKTEKERIERKSDVNETRGTRFGLRKQQDRNSNLEHLKVEHRGEGNNVQVPLMKNLFSLSESTDDVESGTQAECVEHLKLTRKKLATVAETSESLNNREVNTEMSKGGIYSGFDPDRNSDKTNGDKIEKGPSGVRDEWMHTVFLNLVESPDLANDWTQLGKSFSDRRFLSTRWPSILLNYLAHKEDRVSGLFEIGMSLADFVKTFGDKHIVLRLVASVSLCVHQGGDNCHDQAFRLYDELCSMTDVLDSSSALLLIRAFAKTNRWRKCLDFLEMAKISGMPSPGHYAPLINAALKAGEANMVDELFREMFMSGIAPSEEVFKSLIQHDNVLKLLDLLQIYAWIPSESLAMQICDHFTSLNPTEEWTGQVTKIDRRSQCKACSGEVNHLPRISDVDFDRLRTVFMTNAVLKKGNVFLNTSPEEVNAFRDFLSQHATFDVIIDGLNVAHQTRQKASVNERDYVLSQVIQYFTGKNKKVLVFGRKHMKSWKSSNLHSKLTAGQLEWFYAENISADDPFMLYAALQIGQNASIVTNDELRDHRFLLGAELADLLKMWQRGHQVLFSGLRRQSGKDFPTFKVEYLCDRTPHDCVCLRFLGELEVSAMVASTMEVATVVTISVFAAVFFGALIALVILLKKRYCKPMDLISAQYLDNAPDADLVGHMEGLSENPSGVELDEVCFNPNLDQIFKNEAWASDAVGLVPHCLAILKVAHLLTEKLVNVTLTNAQQLQFPETLTDLVSVARRIGSRVDDVVRSMYPPLDPRLLEARCSALVLSVNHLVMLAKTSCSLSRVLDWVDQSLADVEDHLKVLREASIAYENSLRIAASSSSSHPTASNDPWEGSFDDGCSREATSTNQNALVPGLIRESSQV